jgi:hypothetical protein
MAPAKRPALPEERSLCFRARTRCSELLNLEPYERRAFIRSGYGEPRVFGKNIRDQITGLISIQREHLLVVTKFSPSGLFCR